MVYSCECRTPDSARREAAAGFFITSTHQHKQEKNSMFVVKWIMTDGSERIYGGRDIRFTPAATSETQRDSVSFIDADGTPCSFDMGRIYVVNDLGKTVANYLLGSGLPAAA